MTIFIKCMQKLRHSACSIRLYQSLITIACIAVVFGLISGSPPIWHKLGIQININNINPFATPEPRGSYAAQMPSVRQIGVCNRQKMTFVKERNIMLSFDLAESISIPLVRLSAYDKIPCLEFSSRDETWRTTAIYTQSIGELMAGLTSSQGQDSIPLIAFVQDVHGDDYVIVIGKNKESSLSSLQFLLKESSVVRKEKYLGIKLPRSSLLEDRVAFYIQLESANAS
jgi:hypothetical protein